MIIKKEIRLKILTPLMIGGIDEITRPNRKENERLIREEILRHTNLNVNSIRGSSRWWLRALHGWSDKLKEIEKEIFGSTEGASPIKMNLKVNLESYLWKKDRNLKIYGKYSFSKGEGNYNGYDYFAFTNKVQKPIKGRKGEYQTTVRKYYKPDDAFDLNIIGDKNNLEKYFVILWIVFQFGGIGNRARRCFGNLQIENPTAIKIGDKSFHFKNQYKSIDEYKKTIKNNFDLIKQVFPNCKFGNNKISTFNGARLFLSEPCPEPGWKEAINFAGVVMQVTRATKHPEYIDLRKTPFPNLKLPRPIFGLPINFRFSNNTQVVVNYFENDQNQTRFASPIIVSLVKIGDNFHVQYLILSRDYSDLKVKAKRVDSEEIKAVEIDSSAVDKFIMRLKNFELEDQQYSYQEIPLA